MNRVILIPSRFLSFPAPRVRTPPKVLLYAAKSSGLTEFMRGILQSIGFILQAGLTTAMLV